MAQNEASIKVNSDGTVTLDFDFALSLGRGPIKTTMSKEQFIEYYENSALFNSIKNDKSQFDLPNNYEFLTKWDILKDILIKFIKL